MTLHRSSGSQSLLEGAATAQPNDSRSCCSPACTSNIGQDVCDNSGILQAPTGVQAQADSKVELPTRLNNVPHQREVRQFFYKDVTEAILKAVRAGEKRVATRQAQAAVQGLETKINESMWGL